MTAFDPSLDQSQKPPLGLPRDAREAAFLRHDIDRTLGAVLTGLSGVAAADFDARTRELLDQAAIAARTLAGLIRAMRGETPVVEELAISRLVARLRGVHAAEARARGLILAVEVEGEV